jgi:putative membrane protein
VTVVTDRRRRHDRSRIGTPPMCGEPHSGRRDGLSLASTDWVAAAANPGVPPARTAATGMLPTNRRPTMTGHAHRLTTISLALFCAGALGACSKADRTADTAAARTDSAAGRLDSTAAARTDSGMNNMANAANNAGAWTNDHIFGFAHNANAGEIALGKLASTKATNAKVKEFGREMVKDHTEMMSDMHSLMGKVNGTVDSTWNDAKDLADHGRDELKDLTDKAKGADWDKDYIDKMVDDHQKVLDKLQDAAKSTTDSTVSASLAKATAKVQEHLTKAQSIKAGLE